jgi:hypothetical protein
MRSWILRGAVILLGALLLGALLWVLLGSGHDPNHDINMERARAAANRVHKPPPAGFKMGPEHGG